MERDRTGKFEGLNSSNDVNLRIRTKNNCPFILILFLKKDKKGYELRLTDGSFNYDIFIHYKFNETHDWSLYQLGRRKYK